LHLLPLKVEPALLVYLISGMELHTFATNVTLSKGVPIESVGKMLGHKSLKTTQIYAKVLDEKVGKDLEALEEKMRLQK
jgi:site-specific recombinase XerD